MVAPPERGAIPGTGPHGREADILLEVPIAHHADVAPAVEDRSYIVFIAGALAVALFGGFILAILLALAESGLVWEQRVPWLIQAHGWAQLQGWGGLFVAGMGLRLLPRFAGRHPLPKLANMGLFIPLFLGTVLRTVAQSAGSGRFAAAGLLVGELLWSIGAAAFGLTILVTLVRGRRRLSPWRLFGLCGALWWLAWSALSIVAGIRGARNDGYVPASFDEALTWVVILGAIGNFIWAVQSRSVPIFFGRTSPGSRKMAAPLVLLNVGVAALCVAALKESDGRLVGSGLFLAGVAFVVLAPTAGSCWGTAKRLRPRARVAARFVLFANNAAVVGGLLLIWAGGRTFADDEFAAAGFRDAARHALGAGMLTLLIVGMSQLVAPFFAMQRLEQAGASLMEHAVFWTLATAAALRVLSALLLGHIDSDGRMYLAAAAGSLAWVGLAAFAITVRRAVLNERHLKAAPVAAAHK